MLDEQLHIALSGLTDGEVLSIVMNTPGRSGLEAWRRLNKRFDPQSPGKKRSALTRLMNPAQVPLKQLSAAIGKWWELVRNYEDARKTTVDDDVKCVALAALCPDALQHHLHMNTGRLNTSELMLEEVQLFLAAEEAKTSSGPAPMDVDAITEAKAAGQPYFLLRLFFQRW